MVGIVSWIAKRGLRGSQYRLYETCDGSSGEHIGNIRRIGARAKRRRKKHTGSIEIAVDEFETRDDRCLSRVDFGGTV
jgi:hypothetical protein